MDKNLYQLTLEQERINQLLEEAGGEITPEIEALMQINADNATEKLEAYCKSVTNYTAYANELKAESKRLAERAKAVETTVTGLKNQMLTYLLSTDTKKVKAGLFMVSWTPSQSTEILDEEAIPAEYKTEVVTTKIDKTAIKKAINDGKEVPGAVVQENKNLQIK